MDCAKRVLGVTWPHHDWMRRVTATREQVDYVTDQWGRRCEDTYVSCHAEYVCIRCGAARDDGECGCDKARAERCGVRLAYVRGATTTR